MFFIYLQQTNVIVFAVEIQPVPQNYNREIGMTNMIICNTRVCAHMKCRALFVPDMPVNALPPVNNHYEL